MGSLPFVKHQTSSTLSASGWERFSSTTWVFSSSLTGPTWRSRRTNFALSHLLPPVGQDITAHRTTRRGGCRRRYGPASVSFSSSSHFLFVDEATAHDPVRQWIGHGRAVHTRHMTGVGFWGRGRRWTEDVCHWSRLAVGGRESHGMFCSALHGMFVYFWSWHVRLSRCNLSVICEEGRMRKQVSRCMQLLRRVYTYRVIFSMDEQTLQLLQSTMWRLSDN